MPDQTIVAIAPAGFAALTMKLFVEFTDTEVASAATVQGTNDPSLRTAQVDVPIGRYRCTHFSGSDAVTSTMVTISAASGTFPTDSLFDFQTLLTESSATLENQLAILSRLSTAAINVIDPTRNGTDLSSVIGDNDVGNERRVIYADDPGSALHDYLKSVSVTEVKFAASDGDGCAYCSGTITRADISHDAETEATSIPVAIAAEDKPSRAGRYVYHLQAIDGDGGHVKLRGSIAFHNKVVW